MHRILVITPYFLLDALHVSDCISPSSGATFISCTSHLVSAYTGMGGRRSWLYTTVQCASLLLHMQQARGSNPGAEIG